jgi:thiol-disulfide isomerase/thioredoxin
MKGTWAYEMVINRPYYFANPKDDPRLQDYEKRAHFWDGFDAHNPRLINTPLYSEHILNYLRYWMNPAINFSAEEKTEGFKHSVDIILRQFSGNEQTYEFAYKYLSLGFKEIGEEAVLQYLDEHYRDLANRCFDEVEKSELEKRMAGYAAMKAGNAAPNFIVHPVTGVGAKDLYSLPPGKTLLVFWSSTCPHCMEELPKLNEWVATREDLQVLAVSIDTDTATHLQAIKNFPNFIHSCNYKGWQTEAAISCYIAATPTFIMLDTDKKIAGKYSSFEQVKEAEQD